MPKTGMMATMSIDYFPVQMSLLKIGSTPVFVEK
jgi:hypothetical protein